MSRHGGASAWHAGAGYVLVAALPLAAALIADPLPVRRSWPAALSVAAGFVAFGVIAWQVVLVARLGWLSRAIGSDALMHMHRGLAVVGLVFLVVHPALLAPSLPGAAWNPVTGTDAMRPGAAAFWAVVVIGITSWARRPLHLRYEAWHALHLGLALVAVVGAALHIVSAGSAAREGLSRGIVLTYAGGALGIVAWYRLVRPLRLARCPWRVVANDDVGGSTRCVRVVPDGHAGWPFDAGQFAWVSTGRRPIFAQQHPLSIASSDAGRPADGLDLAVKALGDWSGTVVPRLRPGDRLWVDGPFGAAALTRVQGATGLLLVAGGIGIAPIRAVVTSLADRNDRRPLVLVHAASSPARAVFADEMAAFAGRLVMTVVPVYEAPPDGWTGERGYVTRDVLARYLPADASGWACFACGPEPMMRAIERHARDLGVPAAAVHTERFTMV